MGPKQLSFIDRKLRKNSQQKRKIKKMKEKEREKESHEYEKKRKVLNRVASIIIDSWMFPIEEKHPIRGVAIEESAKVSLSFSLSLSLARKMTPTYTSKLTDEIFNQISPIAIPPTFLRH